MNSHDRIKRIDSSIRIYMTGPSRKDQAKEKRQARLKRVKID